MRAALEFDLCQQYDLALRYVKETNQMLRSANSGKKKKERR